ncbi:MULTISPECIES: type II toxin-antitoxin system HipA family toxin [Comamonas]|uniref:type II toxin-antitoxin system HipA family toxin n=1 Tax=Comamonas TaxID=283 RepID=UPI00050F11AD|nr:MULTISPECIES: type II toxin-antitoxin system HipA family toxin [Comamonas]KGG93784.1 phosphatidylinositol kinase [Comamonas thiooxydans]KGG99731.1 phosphatidylinositol kinase [Comamonas thiooxydans]KGH05779.1 phosphatidylinositol kinase [Comamonas thiooxydans]KGH14422.1 phosphatidylinositol kinase [Comamonas thiooxydans]TZG09566.1 type II toxin-antitoxin system HipA family toxin [Comamonas thiooxydans]
MSLPINAVSPRTYVPQDQLYVWAMVNPAAPTLVGELSLSQLVADCATFTYTPDWWNFALSEDMPIVQGQIFSTGERNTAPGAIDDARPDRWGERIIRHIDRPVRLSILEMLLFAGDDRFGALGVSTSAEQYIPRYLGPYPQLKDLAQLAAAVEDVQTQAPITAEIQRLIQPGVTLGGARPKALLQTDNGPCVIKFSELDDPVDTPLIEHATMTLAAQAGMYVADTAVLPLPPRYGKARHALTIERFDRLGPYRVHCQSAHTALRAAGLEQSYSNLATILLRLGHPDRQAAMREELFKRMVFNILMDNTDDHERNHSISLNLADGYYDLTPAYDVVPSLQNLGYQALVVGTAGSESSLENALTQINEYGIKMPRAIELIRQMAAAVDRWAAHFTALGVSKSDMELLAASIDRDALRSQRQAFL